MNFLKFGTGPSNQQARKEKDEEEQGVRGNVDTPQLMPKSESTSTTYTNMFSSGHSINTAATTPQRRTKPGFHTESQMLREEQEDDEEEEEEVEHSNGSNSTGVSDLSKLEELVQYHDAISQVELAARKSPSPEVIPEALITPMRPKIVRPLSFFKDSEEVGEAQRGDMTYTRDSEAVNKVIDVYIENSPSPVKARKSPYKLKSILKTKSSEVKVPGASPLRSTTTSKENQNQAFYLHGNTTSSVSSSVSSYRQTLEIKRKEIRKSRLSSKSAMKELSMSEQNMSGSNSGSNKSGGNVSDESNTSSSTNIYRHSSTTSTQELLQLLLTDTGKNRKQSGSKVNDSDSEDEEIEEETALGVVDYTNFTTLSNISEDDIIPTYFGKADIVSVEKNSRAVQSILSGDSKSRNSGFKKPQKSVLVNKPSTAIQDYDQANSSSETLNFTNKKSSALPTKKFVNAEYVSGASKTVLGEAVSSSASSSAVAVPAPVMGDPATMTTIDQFHVNFRPSPPPPIFQQQQQHQESNRFRNQALMSKSSTASLESYYSANAGNAQQQQQQQQQQNKEVYSDPDSTYSTMEDKHLESLFPLNQYHQYQQQYRCPRKTVHTLLICSIFVPPFYLIIATGVLDYRLGAIDKKYKIIAAIMSVFSSLLILFAIALAFGYGLTHV